MNIMMLTAGEGTRLRPHTNHLPKPAIPFLTVPLYAYSLHFLKDIAVNQVVMNTFHLPQKLKSVVNSFHYQSPIHFSDETKLMGSGGGVWFARSYLQNKGDFIFMNGDEIILPSISGQLEKAIAQHKSTGAIATILVMDHSEVGTKFGGVWVDQKSQVLGFGKKQIDNSNKGYHFIGVALFSDKIFNYLPIGESNILYDALTTAIKAGQRADVYPIQCKWFETGNEADFLTATKDCVSILNSHSPEATYLKNVINWRSPNTEWKAQSGKFVIADKNVKYDFDSVDGFNVFSEGVVLKKSGRVKDSILGPRVQIKNADLLDSKMIINESDVF